MEVILVQRGENVIFVEFTSSNPKIKIEKLAHHMCVWIDFLFPFRFEYCVCVCVCVCAGALVSTWRQAAPW